MVFKKSIMLFFIIGLSVFLNLQSVSAVNLNRLTEDGSPILLETTEDVQFFYYFYRVGCPWCDKMEIWFEDELKPKFPELEIRKIRVDYGFTENIEFFFNLSRENFGIEEQWLGAVPATFIGEYYIIGYPGSRDKILMKERVLYCLENKCSNPQTVFPEQARPIRDLGYITLPMIGEINIERYSFPVLTVMIAAADGFNPCALWILLFLLALVLKEPSRKRLVTIVGTFILVSGFFYFFLLSAWLELFLIIGYLRIIQVIIALVALTMGFWQVKSFIVNKPKVCPISRPSSKFRNIIVEKAKKIVTHRSLFFAIMGIATLAVVVNLFEFICSAGFPAVWTSLLAQQGFPSIINYGFILLYVFIFMMDQIIIFTIAFITLKITKVGEKFGKWVGLIGGLLMIILGLLILFRPEWLVFI